jgi:secreted trypsin-like serine protease
MIKKHYTIPIIIAVSTILAMQAYGGDNTRTARSTSPRIIGGYEALPGAWPWMAALMNVPYANYYSGFICGGSLVHPNWVVTAAHCMVDDNNTPLPPESTDVVLNIHDLNAPTGSILVSLKKVVVHPSYIPFDNDIALLELQEPVFLTDIPLFNDTTNSLAGQNSTVIGWGTTTYPAFSYPNKLQEVSLPIITNEVCNAAMGGIISSLLCAGPVGGGKDSCFGDSGGPLMVFETDAWKLAGIVSNGEGCALPNKYGIYTRVSEFINFIVSNIQPTITAGDLNLDGRVGLDDAIGGLQTVAGMRPEYATAPVPVPGDLNNSGHIGLDDVVGILQLLAGKP